jgi:iron(III) transport system permease protein
VPATVQTATLAAAAAALTTVLAFPFAWVAVRYRGFFARFVEGSNFVTSSMPGIVTALALVTVAIRVAPPLYQTISLVLVAYVLMFIPRAMVNLRTGLAQVPSGIEEASRSLGVSPTLTFVRVTLRLTAPAAAAGASLVFVAVATELTATLLLAPTGTNTLAMRFWSLSSELDYAAAAPFAFLLVVLSVPVTLVLFRQSARAAAL